MSWIYFVRVQGKAGKGSVGQGRVEQGSEGVLAQLDVNLITHLMRTFGPLESKAVV